MEQQTWNGTKLLMIRGSAFYGKKGKNFTAWINVKSIVWFVIYSPWPQTVTLFSKKNFKKVWQFANIYPKGPFLDYNKTKQKKKKSVTIWKKVWQFGKKCDNLEKNVAIWSVTIWGHVVHGENPDKILMNDSTVGSLDWLIA